MNPYKNNGTRIAVHLHHPALGTMEFAWDSSDWMVVCFHSANPGTYPCVGVGGVAYSFRSSKPVTVEKKMGRSIWNALVEQDKKWTTTLAPCAPSNISELEAARP